MSDRNSETTEGKKKTRTLKGEKVAERWATVIEGGQGKADRVFEIARDFLEKSEAPSVSWETVDAQPSRLKGLVGKKREHILVVNKDLKPYRMYIGARDYGTHLDVSWFLTEEPSILRIIGRLFLSAITFGIYLIYWLLFKGPDIFDQQDLRAYVTVGHHAVLRAVDTLMEELNQDISRIDRKSKGFLEVW